VVLAIVLDLDGTLIDSVPDVRLALNRLLVEEKGVEIDLPTAMQMVGEGAKALIARAFPDARAERQWELLLRYRAFYEAHPVVETVVYPGVVETLKALKAAGHKLGICTNKPAAITKLVLVELGFDKLMDGVTADDFSSIKPDPAHIREALKRMGADGLSPVMVGDSASDINAAKRAGIPSVAVSYGYAKCQPAELGADRLIDRFDQLPAVLAEMFP
jgi:phosphoglycolate phosphatase